MGRSRATICNIFKNPHKLWSMKFALLHPSKHKGLRDAACVKILKGFTSS